MKEERIEILDPLKGPKPLTRDLAGCARLGVIIVARIPAFERDFADGIFSLHKIVPQLGRIGGGGILSSHPDNGNGLRARLSSSCHAVEVGQSCFPGTRRCLYRLAFFY